MALTTEGAARWRSALIPATGRGRRLSLDQFRLRIRRNFFTG